MTKIITSDNNGYYFKIYIPDNNPFDEEYANCLMIDRPELQYNADNFDNESIFFPSSLKVEFYCETELFDLLCNNEITIKLYVGSECKYHGYIDLNEIFYNPLMKTYKLTFLDYSKKIKDTHYSQIDIQPYLVTYNNYSIIHFTDIIKACLPDNYQISLNVPEDYVMAKTNYILSGEYIYAGFANMLSIVSAWFDGGYETAFDIIHNLLISFGMLGFFDGLRFRIKCRFIPHYRIISTYELSEVTNILPYDYITASIRTGTGRDQLIFDYRNNQLIEPKKRIDLKFEILGGRYPSNPNYNWSNYYARVPGVSDGVPPQPVYDEFQMNSFRLLWGPPDAPWAVILNKTVDRISRPRRKITITSFDYCELFDTITIDGQDYIIISTKQRIFESKYRLTAISI